MPDMGALLPIIVMGAPHHYVKPQSAQPNGPAVPIGVWSGGMVPMVPVALMSDAGGGT